MKYFLLLPILMLGSLLACGGDDNEDHDLARATPPVGGDDPQGDPLPGDDQPPPGEQVTLFLMDGEAPEGAVGTATLIAEELQRTLVSITILEDQLSGEELHPAYIGTGTCDDRSDIAYPLADVVANKSETTVGIGLTELFDGTYFVTVQLDDDARAGEVVGCAEVVTPKG